MSLRTPPLPSFSNLGPLLEIHEYTLPYPVDDVIFGGIGFERSPVDLEKFLALEPWGWFRILRVHLLPPHRRRDFMGKYEENMEKYVENMKKYEEICGKYEENMQEYEEICGNTNM